ncbi:MAG: HEAT repeat domain-containing protein [Deltaproteobacteria bacterium]|nr:HEAT repeat domain-containing protein [Deltaproteobacteria bacterium]
MRDRRTLALLSLVAALATSTPVTLRADSAQDRERVRQLVSLLGNHDFRVRVQACLSLGRVGGSGARVPLERALRDDQPAVRAAAAVSLARLGDRAALPALRRTQMDSATVVRQQIDLAIRALSRLAPDEVDWNAIRVAIGVGAMANRSQVRGDELRQRLRDVILGELRAAGTVVITPGAPDARFLQEVGRRRVERYFLEGTVAHMSRQSTSRTQSVRCEISLMVLSDPGRELRMLLNGAATAEESRDNFNVARERRMQDQALEGAVRGAFSRLLRTLSTPARATVRR